MLHLLHIELNEIYLTIIFVHKRLARDFLNVGEMNNEDPAVEVIISLIIIIKVVIINKHCACQILICIYQILIYLNDITQEK